MSFGSLFWRQALAQNTPGNGPYGPLGPPDANGIQLPPGFSSRVIAQSGQAVPGTAYVFPPAPDGQATFPTPDGGWILVTNTEVFGTGGVSAIRFDAAGTITAAYRILDNTHVNCAGGATPWGSWLSCEEISTGRVWECDPTGGPPIVRPLLGVFQHEACCVDPTPPGYIYLSEDLDGGCLYRFIPDIYPRLDAGRLEVACDDGGNGRVAWKTVPEPDNVTTGPLRDRVPGAFRFARGEGIWYDAGLVYLATTTDQTIHVYDTAASEVSVLYRADDTAGTPLRGVDNLHVSRSGDLFVAEDSYTGDPDAMDVCIVSPEREIARFLKLTGPGHFVPGAQSETVGITFDPSGTRMYIGSQRYLGKGIVYEITGPFRQVPPGVVPVRTPRPKSTSIPTPAPTATAIATAVPTTTPSTNSGLGTNPGAPGLPIGIDVTRRITIPTLIAKGLAIIYTLDQPASVRVRLTARITEKGRRRTVTLATLSKRSARGRTVLRLRPTKAAAKLLRPRRRVLTATLEVRFTTEGAPVRTIRQSVSLRPKK